METFAKRLEGPPSQYLLCCSLNRNEWSNLSENSSVLCMSLFQGFVHFREIQICVDPHIRFLKIIDHQGSNGLVFYSIHSHPQIFFKHDLNLFNQEIESVMPYWQFACCWPSVDFWFNECSCPWVFQIIQRTLERDEKEPGIGWFLNWVVKLNSVVVGRCNDCENNHSMYMIHNWILALGTSWAKKAAAAVKAKALSEFQERFPNVDTSQFTTEVEFGDKNSATGKVEFMARLGWL